MVHRNEFRAWTDIKPVKPIKARPQYKPPDDKMVHETSYSAQFKGEAGKPTPADNKFVERRRIRSLYSEPFKEPPKVRQISWGAHQHSLGWRGSLQQSVGVGLWPSPQGLDRNPSSLQH